MEDYGKEKPNTTGRRRSNTLQSAPPRRPTPHPPKLPLRLPIFEQPFESTYGDMVEEWVANMSPIDTTLVKRENEKEDKGEGNKFQGK